MDADIGMTPVPADEQGPEDDDLDPDETVEEDPADEYPEDDPTALMENTP